VIADTADIDTVYALQRGEKVTDKPCRTAAGHDMPITAARMEFAARDIVAILDHLGVQKAWILGSSYGVFLALQLGVLAPERIDGMFLDSGFPAARYEHYIRRRNRRLLWNGAYPPLRSTAQRIRRLHKIGRIGDSDTDPLFAVYEWLGPEMLERLLVTLEKRPILEYRLLKKILRSKLPESVPYVALYQH
jgi:pimeloyl-ACP methyl ester carboxylesterase